jgi:hypothetical protein
MIPIWRIERLMCNIKKLFTFVTSDMNRYFCNGVKGCLNIQPPTSEEDLQKYFKRRVNNGVLV